MQLSFRWLWFIPVVVFVVSLYNRVHQQPALEKALNETSQPITVLVIHDELPNRQVAKKGHKRNFKHLFLARKHENHYALLSSLEELKKIDGDDNEILDQADPLYHQLYVGSIDKETLKFKYHHISKTAIKGIQMRISDDNSIHSAHAVIPTRHQQTDWRIKIEPAEFDYSELKDSIVLD